VCHLWICKPFVSVMLLSQSLSIHTRKETIK